jgi:hypothetical protein
VIGQPLASVGRRHEGNSQEGQVGKEGRPWSEETLPAGEGHLPGRMRGEETVGHGGAPAPCCSAASTVGQQCGERCFRKATAPFTAMWTQSVPASGTW